jgi:foldase protein PrsA
MMVVLAVLVVALSSSAFAAAKAVKTAKKFDQTAALMETWKAPDSAVVGTVNGVAVTKGELMKSLWLFNAPRTLQDMLNQKMIEEAARKEKVSLTEKDIQDKIQQSLKQMQMKSVDQLLSQYRITWYQFMYGTRVSALAEKTVQKQVKVTDAEYAEWIKARHILIRLSQDEKDKTKQKEMAKAKADGILAKIKAGEDFSKLADLYSDDPGNEKDGKKLGGDLPWFNRGQMVAEFEKAAFDLKAGQVSEPVETAFGYHIIKVEKLGRDATGAEKAEIKKMILERKLPMEMNQWFLNLQEKAKIDNKLAAPPEKAPRPVMRPTPVPRPMTAPRAPAPAPQPTKPAEPPAGDKPETPPPPPTN